MANKNINSDSITKAILGNKKKKKQKLATGGEVLLHSFEYNSLSDQDKKAYDSLTPEQQAQVRTQFDAQGNSSQSVSEFGNALSSSGESSVGSSISGIIGAVMGIAENAGGEQDEYGAYGSDVETYLAKSSDIGGNIQTGIDDLKDGNIIGGIGNILQLGGAINSSADDDVKEAKLKEQELKQKNAYYSNRQSKSFADGGKIPENDPNFNAAKEIVDYIKISSPEYNTEIQKNINSIPQMKEIPIGTDKDGKVITEWRADQNWNTAKKIEGDYRPQAPNELRNTLVDYSGFDYKDIDNYDRKSSDFKKQLEDNLDDTLKNLKNSGKKEYQDIDLNIRKDSQGNYTYGVLRLDRKRTTSLDNTDGKQGLAEGGKIEGKGTGKSDSINAEMPAGSYILPSDAPDYVTKRLTKYLGYDEAKLNHSNGEKVKVSDGEILILPEDVDKADQFVRRLGYDNGLDEMAPNSKYKLSERPGYADGGQIGNLTGTIAGVGQILLGMFESSKNEEPKSNTEQMLRDLSNEVRLRAEYGLNPYERTQAENAIERSFAAERNIINNVSGGSLDVIINNSAAAAIRANNARLGLEVQSSRIQQDKERYADEITMKAIQANEQEFQLKYNKYLSGEEAAAGLIHSGIANVVGQSQKNQYQQMMLDERQKDRDVNKEFLDSILEMKKKNNIKDFENIVSQNTSWGTNIKGI